MNLGPKLANSSITSPNYNRKYEQVEGTTTSDVAPSSRAYSLRPFVMIDRQE
jgi:hypothetical protein